MKPCIRCGGTERYKNGNCKPCTLTSIKRWKDNNQERVKEVSKKYHDANREKRNATAKKHAAQKYAENPEKFRARSRSWAYNNKEKKVSRLAKWKLANPEAGKRYDARKRARKLENGGHLSKGLSKRLFDLQKGKCACCRQTLGKKYHMDHMMPLALGGANEDKNIQLLCPMCNMSKHAKHPVEFMQSRGFLI